MVDFGFYKDRNFTNLPMANSPKKQPQPSNNPALDELSAIRHEMSEFRKEFVKLNKELSMRIAFGVIGSLVLMWMIAGFFGLLGAVLLRR